jgi:hypothetical protein
MGRKLAFGLIAAAAFLGTSATAAPSKPARCDVGNNYGEHYVGPCLFTADSDGSFSVSRAKGAAIMGDITVVTVQIIEAGTAEVRGLTRAGINSRWGSAQRSKRDRACWRGSDFWVCAY